MSFWYLATPYSKYEGGITEAYKMAARNAAVLVKAGVPVFSPIAHTHPIAVYGDIDPFAHEIWLPADGPFMEAARGLLVLEAAGWQDSHGVKEEIKAFARMGKPILFMQPGVVPEKTKLPIASPPDFKLAFFGRTIFQGWR